MKYDSLAQFLKTRVRIFWNKYATHTTPDGARYIKGITYRRTTK